MSDVTLVGLIGCGNISEIYLRNIAQFAGIEVAAVADLDMERAAARAAQYGVRAASVEALLADPTISIAINLTIPAAHAAVSLAALAAGKHVYSEKPLAVAREDGERILALAAERGLRVGCAPDTALGAGLQTCRQLLDAGTIGMPVAASAYMGSAGPESWHPNPESFYQPGAGPLFDMGPYYLTSLIQLLGPVRRVSGTARMTYPERVATSEARRGAIIPVQTPTHVVAVLEFVSGPVATLVTSFDTAPHTQPPIELYGSAGTLLVPDPNTFGGPVQLRLRGDDAWREVPLTHPNSENSRGIGVLEMAQAIRAGRPHRASGEVAYHVLDSMHTIYESSNQGRHLVVASSCPQPAPLPLDLAEGMVVASPQSTT